MSYLYAAPSKTTNIFDELNVTAVYAAPVEPNVDKYPILPVIPAPVPNDSEEDAKQKTIYLNSLCDEFDIMRAISKLPKDAQSRIYDWLGTFI